MHETHPDRPVQIDWSTSFLKPLCYRLTDHQLILASGGEEIVFTGDLLSLTPVVADIQISAVYGDFLTLSAKAVVAEDGLITRVSWFAGAWSGYEQMQIISTGLSSICVFLRKGAVSFFISLDFPYSRINGAATVSYDPYDPVKAGESYPVHTLSIGAAWLTGDRPFIGSERGLCDRAEIEAMSAYIENRFPSRFNRPIFTGVSITNRMTDVREGRIFYSMYDNPTLTLDLATVEQELDLHADLGLEYYQVFEGYFDWTNDGRTEEAMAHFMDHARRAGVRAGDYVHPGELYCPHYNYEHRYFDKPEWRALWDGGKRGELCFGCDDFVSFLSGELCASIKKHGEEIICLDMLRIAPCHDVRHGHADGDLYRQIRGLVRFMDDLSATGPEFLTWTNSGSWQEFMPKLIWHNPNAYLTDPHARHYSSSLNMLKYYGDCRREQMVSVHNKYFIPYASFTNCEYYIFRFSRVEDLQFFEYSFLQGLCVTPNICLGELRTFIERIPSGKVAACKAFIRKWLGFMKEHFDIWRHTSQIGDSPAPGANEIYAHIKGDRGWICLINQNHQTQTARFSLDETIGLSGASHYLLTEEYPSTAPVAEQRLPCAGAGDALSLAVPPHAVRIIRIEPYQQAGAGLRLYGIDGRISRSGSDYHIEVSGESGRTYDLALVCEPGRILADLQAEAIPTVPMYTFPPKLEQMETDGPAARFRLTMPRDVFERELLLWTVDGSAPVRLGLANSDFCGGYIHNFYRENQAVRLRLTTAGAVSGAAVAAGLMPAIERPEPVYPAIPRRAAVYETEFDVPFIEWNTSVSCIGYDEVIELVFSDASLVRTLKTAIDGKPCDIYRLYYPVRSMSAYCLELHGYVRSGSRAKLRLEVEWDRAAGPGQPEGINDKPEDGPHVLGA